MSYRVMYFYLHYFNVIFVKLKYVAAMKIRSGNLALNIQTSDKILLPRSVLRTEPGYKREVLSIHLHFKQTFVVRDLQHQ